MGNEKIRLAIMAPTLNLCNYLFGIEQGFFRKEGIEVEVIVRPGLHNTEAVAQGEADFGAANECVIQTALRGPTDLKILLQVLKDPLHDLIVPAEIQGIQELRGKSIAIPGAGSTPEIQTRWFFQKNGLIPDRDVFLVPQVSPETMADRVRKFEEGAYTGLIASPPTPFLLHAKGFKSLTELSTHFPGTASHGLVATTATIAQRRPLVEAVVRSYVRGVTALKEDRGTAVDFISRYFHLEPSLAVRGYDLLKDRWTAELSLDSLRSEIDFQARNAGVNPIVPESITDPQFAAIR
ncbi:MAG: ABC transporter substrate-binding protein [Candidatus Tectomicrobia bacterium]|uniref:ABC transporter substrate-binding protein n=1 Tax=Tectimicrobiota bacterium TaxID=2528274 RepID=A0A932GRF7_UNCTE|nr:ABC transporter substrate-binding protein [Candidatus Tectomicrobia bacterium]